jgi:hypothetical protein
MRIFAEQLRIHLQFSISAYFNFTDTFFSVGGG